MASSLRWFRRHSKLLMVFFGVGLMAVFGLGSVVSMINPGDLTAGREDPVIAKWKGGDITRNDLRSLQTRHFQTMRFLDGLRFAAAKQKGDEFQSLAIPISRVAQGGNFNQDDVDVRLLYKILMNELAKEEGIVVNEDMVDEYLGQIRGYVPMSANDMAAINREVNQGQAAMESIRRHLQFELAAQQMDRLVAVTIEGSHPRIPRIPNPLDAIELYTKSNRRIECQVLPVEVNTDVVSESPSESEIRKIFDEGKYSYPQVDREKPGFKIGKKVRIQYFVANRDNFLQNEINKLTDAEVQAEYERLVAEEDSLVMELVPVENEPEINDPNEAGTDDAAPSQPENNDDDAAPKPSDDAAKSEDDSAPEIKAPSTTEEGESTGPETTEKSEDGGEGEQGAEENNEGGDGLAVSVANRSPQYVSTSIRQESEEESKAESTQEAAQEKEEEEGGAQEKEDPESEEAKPAEKPQDPPAEAKDEQESSTPAAGDEENQDAEKADPLPGSLEDMQKAAPQQQDPVLPGLADEPAEPKRRPKALADCAQAIKESLKRADTTAAIKNALDRADAEIGTYRMRHIRWKNNDKAKPEDEPTPIDFAAIADKYLLEFNETELLEITELIEEEIGKVRVLRQVMGQDGRPQSYFPSIAELTFGQFQDINLFDPARETDLTSTYSYWLAEKTDARVPELKEAKGDVIRFWKQNRAFEAAMNEAQEIADKINNSTDNQTLAALYPAKAVSTGEFSWFNTVGGQPRISSPVGTLDVGEVFMNAAFSLGQYEAAAAPNATRENVYVIQLMSAKATIAETGQDYLENRYFKFKTIPSDVRNISMYYTQDLYNDWQKEFFDRMDLELVGQ